VSVMSFARGFVRIAPIIGAMLARYAR